MSKYIPVGGREGGGGGGGGGERGLLLRNVQKKPKEYQNPCFAERKNVGRRPPLIKVTGVAVVPFRGELEFVVWLCLPLEVILVIPVLYGYF